MVLTNKQEEALKICLQRYRDKEPYTCIAGYAGVGKSTVVKFIISALQLAPEEVAYVSFTGKAASVLNQKGCPNASTAHKLLYFSKRLPTGNFIFKPRESLDGNYKLIIVDEVSMLPADLWALLLSHRIHIIALGDPFQLPPIYKETDNHVLDHPHVFLDEVMRQAKDSEIIRLSMDIRAYKPIFYQKGNEVQVVHSSQVVGGMYTWADQIITATNKKRKEINDYMRKVNGFGTEPQVGDKIICCRNCWETFDKSGMSPLINGTIGYLTKATQKDLHYSMMNGLVPTTRVVNASFKSEFDEEYTDILIDYKALSVGEKFLTPQQEYKLSKNSAYKHFIPVEFNYGYAITCHRAQGSQWDKVLVFEESFPRDREEHARWLYTACTRPAKKLVLVK